MSVAFGQSASMSDGSIKAESPIKAIAKMGLTRPMSAHVRADVRASFIRDEWLDYGPCSLGNVGPFRLSFSLIFSESFAVFLAKFG